MKNKTTLLVTAAIFILQNSFAVNPAPTVKQQLEDLNEYWKTQMVNDPLLNENISLNGDVELIQMHLWLVEKTLRSKNADHLTDEQKQNRNLCLDILNDYSAKGIFPKNLYHSKRTPYFIDNYGTACAVGQLIISTGYGEFANKVMLENNNAYISELNSIYPDIKEWSDKFGFEIEELAWIQPCYCVTTGPGVLNVTCYGAWNGYFVPNVTGLQPPYVFEYYKWDGTIWQPFFSMCGGCDLSAGDYKCTVSDSAGATQDYFATITQPPAIPLSTSFTNDNGTCNGSAVAVANGGAPGFTYSWFPGGYTTAAISNLCYGTYTVITTETSTGCYNAANVIINLETGLNEISNPVVNTFPNPVLQEVNLLLNNFFVPGKTFATLYNALGKQIIHQNLASANTAINIAQLKSGVYLLKVENGNDVENHRIIKE